MSANTGFCVSGQRVDVSAASRVNQEQFPCRFERGIGIGARAFQFARCFGQRIKRLAARVEPLLFLDRVVIWNEKPLL